MKDEPCLEALERRTRRLEHWLRGSMAAWGGGGIVGVWAFTIGSHSQQTGNPTSLKVSELVVVDPKGVERVRIGGDLPDATINGKRVPRGEKAAGVLLYDTTGQERSGYVTWESGNVGLTIRARCRSACSSPDSKAQRCTCGMETILLNCGRMKTAHVSRQ